MKRQVMTQPGKFIFEDVPIPEIDVEEVLVKIMRIGICGSDIHVFHGKHPYTSYPITQGHEVSGVVEKVGANVTDFKLGDKVTIQPQIVCGQCHPCTHGKYHICDKLKVMGFQSVGMASEYFACDSEYLIKLPDEMSYEQGAMIEPVAVACGALSKVRSLRDFNVVVLGAGTIGNLVGQTAKGLGAKSVLITDISDFRLALAKKVGIDFTVNPSKQEFSKELVEIYGPDKADLIVECVGVNSTITDAIENARKGTDIIIVGVFGEQPIIDLGKVQNQELRLIGSLMYQTKDYLLAIELVSSNKIKLDPLMSVHFPFHEYQKAYEYIDEKKDEVMKVFIDIN
ncbi:MAG: zinc-dependent alcohol dehydrogenase [Candidatus Kariarchaeaceae archaeon]|jgi:L-iditol 2-dehydrogenase